MPTKESSRLRSSSWWDVKVYCLEVGKAHNGYCIVQFSPNLPEKVKACGHWQVCFYPRGRSVEQGYKVARGYQWPHGDFATVPDLLMKAIYDLDWALTDGQVRAEQQANF